MRLLDRGSVFAKRYRIDRPIAVGSAAAIYDATHLEIGRRCALKVLAVESLNSSLRSRFQLEAKVSSPVRSEHVVEVIDAGVDIATSMPFIAMEFLQGTDFAVDVATHGRMAAPRLVTLLSQVASGIDKCHALGIVHRDLKPENLFLSRAEDGSPRVKILDFGIAKILVESTISGEKTAVVGTPLYMAPEQFKGLVSPATDIYSIGMIAYTLLVGFPYWHDESQQSATPFSFMARIVHGPQQPASVRAARMGVRLPSAFDEWFSQCTSPDPRKRFRGAGAAVADLAAALGVPAPPSLPKPQSDPVGGTSPASRSLHRQRHRRILLAVAGAVMSAALLTITIALLKPRRVWDPGIPSPASSGIGKGESLGGPVITVLGEPEPAVTGSGAASARAPAGIRTPAPLKGVPSTWSRH